MASSENDLRDRIRRLEAVVAAFIIADREVDSYLIEFLRGSPPPSRANPDYFYSLLREFAVREPYEKRRSLRNEVEQLREEFAARQKDSAAQRELLSELARAPSQLQIDVHSFFAIQSMGIDLDEVRFTRFLPVRVYVDGDDLGAIERFTKAIDALLANFGFEIADRFPAERGSWFKKSIARLKKAVTHEELMDVTRKIKRGLELAGLEEHQADINKAQADCLSKLLACAKGYHNVALQCGTALVVITSDGQGQKNVIGVTLTATEVIALENNQTLLRSPTTLLEELKKLCDGKNKKQSDPDGDLLPNQPK